MTRLCGRLTTAGRTCHASLQWYEVACLNHATEADDAYALEQLRESVRQYREHETCPCPCHAAVQPGLITCPRCA